MNIEALCFCGAVKKNYLNIKKLILTEKIYIKRKTLDTSESKNMNNNIID